MTAIPYHWIERLLGLLLAPVTHEHWRFFTAWGRSEGVGKAGNNNPLNTTYPMAPWDTSFYNTTPGVKNYRTAVAGVAATAATFAGEDYLLPLWKDLQKGTYTAEQLLSRNQVAIKHWGTDIDLFTRVLAEV